MNKTLRHILGSLRVLRFYIPHLTALAVAVLLGATMGVTSILKHPPATDVTDRWTLPHWAPYQSGPKRKDLTQTTLWAEEPGKRKDDAALLAAKAAPPWRFIGTVRDGRKLLAVIELDQGKRVQRLAMGENLPNGAPIILINAGELTYAQDDVQKTLTLFAPTKDQNFPSAPKKN